MQVFRPVFPNLPHTASLFTQPAVRTLPGFYGTINFCRLPQTAVRGGTFADIFKVALCFL
ncbi:hypothetical protein EPM78_07855 [Neisseria gonorrhoeae]|uniref:Uncharacterized protein n=2 Tax=Neisseria gonorrhoeae TaxID=485 RepID=B4RLU9_NEIG2|nr:Hypothetical protein NGK_1109 [Neisseria gonorrhoeae NCCP11945]ARB99977.1 hypothetical protein A6J43_05975 [Neisseria gonorrhoeae]EEZ50207.1 predicted protein [Neisseria gonorrhoeae PID18]EEZ52536.1 predicted protein [Neisseria gonorrhoeae PID1]EEZ54884.1 predicted protein [Neisseria gonorrhoeae PID332]EEZ57035.1 predicted protein [Neisseria gonorrhoeae SK-92-679]EEZ59356.1 predicted protein [Neisseria gonorrhoeae SK-93-1035]EFE04220.1 conserved hypothetical protein [Neisseria gonorrhoeae